MLETCKDIILCLLVFFYDKNLVLTNLTTFIFKRNDDSQLCTFIFNIARKAV